MIRPAVAADAPAIANIWADGWPDGHLGNVPDELVAVRTRESFHERTPARIPDTSVAEVDGVIAGFVMVKDDEVEQVYVHNDHRGGAVARDILREGERRVRANGHGQAWLAVVDGNARARRFYEREGWRDDGPFEYAAHGGIRVRCHRYIKVV